MMRLPALRRLARSLAAMPFSLLFVAACVALALRPDLACEPGSQPKSPPVPDQVVGPLFDDDELVDVVLDDGRVVRLPWREVRPYRDAGRLPELRAMLEAEAREEGGAP